MKYFSIQEKCAENIGKKRMKSALAESNFATIEWNAVFERQFRRRIDFEYRSKTIWDQRYK